MRVLGIETSCDETGMAIYDSDLGLMAHRLYSQVDLHAQYGGVVPELASRDHISRLVPMIRDLMQCCQTTQQDLDGIAYTAGPGLIGALLVGSSFARSLAWSWDLPAMAIHHLEGHLLAPLMEKPAPTYPFLALLVSGGHTMLVDVRGLGDYHVMGESLDDAAGEAFDKTAKLLGLGYPGGPAIAELAKQGEAGKYRFPRPMTQKPGLDFSFSGLKTFTLNTFQEQGAQEAAHIAHAFQEAVIDTLRIKCQRALKESAYQQLVISGGVSANIRLRELFAQHFSDVQVFYPKLEFCTDNGAMIAFAALMRLQDRCYEENLPVKARWPLEQLPTCS